MRADNATAPSDLPGRTWRLTALERDGQVVTVQTPDRYTVRFDEGRLAVRSDHNSCGGPYALNRTRLQVGTLACTRAFCGTESLGAEFSRALAKATQVSHSGGTLTIQSPGVALRFTE